MERAAADFRAAAAELGRIRQRLAARAASAMAAIHLLSGATLIGTLLAGLPAISSGALGAPLLVGLVLAVVGSFEASAGTVRSVAKLGASMAAAERPAERLHDLAETPPVVEASLEPTPMSDVPSIELRGVGFGVKPGRFILRPGPSPNLRSLCPD